MRRRRAGAAGSAAWPPPAAKRERLTVPASAQFSVESGHVAAIMKGGRTSRLIFDQKAQVLHIVSDDDKTYFDLDKSSGGGAAAAR